ncbi:MAG: hypothetical protein APF81_06345 [Desulfosporosinus sp. BRH_c37]|nr:MAG: hypothetical protein APF81_06345 [Desulfosporosinus sp. BRH_c37]
MDQIKKQLSPYSSYFGHYPLNPNGFRGYKPTFPNTYSCSPSCLPILPSNPTIKLGYWELLSPALFGAAGALFLSLFSTDDHLVKRLDGPLFRLAIVGYAIGATVAVSFAISDVVSDAKDPYDHLICPIGGGLIAIILLFTAEYLLLYRFFPTSFTGNVGDNLWTQILSFLYFSITTIATANLGDIMPTTTTVRVLIATEIAFNLFTLATGIQLLLVQKH